MRLLGLIVALVVAVYLYQVNNGGDVPSPPAAELVNKCVFKVIKEDLIHWPYKNFSATFAERLRGFHTLKDVESKVGSPPTEIAKQGDCSTTYKWLSAYPGLGIVVVTTAPPPSDFVHVTVWPNGNGPTIGGDNYGAFFCDQ